MCVCMMHSTLLFPVVSLQPVPSEATLHDGDEPKEQSNTPEASLVQINSRVRLRPGIIDHSSLLIPYKLKGTGMPISGIRVC